MSTQNKIWIGVGIAGLAALLYFKPWRKKSTDYLNLEPHEIREIDYLIGNFGYTYEEALNITLDKFRKEYKGSSGWS
ncbi:MAG: hypothetical protein QY309_04850 [Cyclobacteriaceae bacterium]|nr:MAG: hypothetical protein QY309_04850 [Cyclobacteriaceae bacterium]